MNSGYYIWIAGLVCDLELRFLSNYRESYLDIISGFHPTDSAGVLCIL